MNSPLGASIMGDLRRFGYNDEQISEFLKPQVVSKVNSPQQNAHLSANEKREEKERAETLQLFSSIQEGNKDILVTSEDFVIMKRDSYNGSFSEIPDGILQFPGKKSNPLLDSMYYFNPSRIAYPDPQSGEAKITNKHVMTSIMFNNSTVTLQRKTIPLPPSKKETTLTMGENGLALLCNPSFYPHVYDWKRMEVIGEAVDIANQINNKINNNNNISNNPSAGWADETGNFIYFSVTNDSKAYNNYERHLSLLEWPVEMSDSLRVLNLYYYDNKNVNLNDDNLSLHLQTKRARLENENYIQSVRFTKHWLVVILHLQPLINDKSASKQPIILYFIDRSKLPPRSPLTLNSLLQNFNDHQQHNSNNNNNIIIGGNIGGGSGGNNGHPTVDVNSFRVEVEVEGRITDVDIAYDDGGNGSNVCISVLLAGSSFFRSESVEKTDRSRSKPRSSSEHLRSFSRSLSKSSVIPGSVDESIIGIPCTDQNSDHSPHPVRLFFVDPSNPPPLQISRSHDFSSSFKGTIGVINKREAERTKMIYLSIGTIPELDIDRTSDVHQWNSAPACRQFPTLFTEEKKFQFTSPTWISGVTFIPKSSSSSKPPSSDPSLEIGKDRNIAFMYHSEDNQGGFIAMACVSFEEEEVQESIYIFDVNEFEKGPAFVLRSKSVERRLFLGVSNYFGSWCKIDDL